MRINDQGMVYTILYNINLIRNHLILQLATNNENDEIFSDVSIMCRNNYLALYEFQKNVYWN